MKPAPDEMTREMLIAGQIAFIEHYAPGAAKDFPTYRQEPCSPAFTIALGEMWKAMLAAAPIQTPK